MKKELYFGYGECIINPGRTIGLAGYDHRGDCGFGNSGILDDLYAQALAVTVDEENFLIITLDLCVMEAKTADEIRKAVSEKINLPLDHIMLALSHTHSGPVTAEDYFDISEEEAAEVRSYLNLLKKSIAAISAEALSRKQKARLFSATYKAVLGFNRRYTERDENGIPFAKMLFNMWLHPGHKTEGVVDENIPILMIDSIDDGSEDFYLRQGGCKTIILYSPPYHPVVMGQHSRMVSADYVGAARACIQDALCPGTKAMFLYGASGNVEPALATQYNPKSIEIVGRAIGYGILNQLAMRKEIDAGTIQVLEEDVPANAGSNSRIKTQTVCFGDACIAGVSGECFTELGIAIRNASKFKQTLIATNANGGRGYLPVKDAFPLGGHEVKSAVQKGYAADLFDTVLSVIKENMEKGRLKT